MKIFLKTGFVIVLFICSFLKSEAKGRDITIFLKDSTEVKGELLAVRDSLVAIAVEPIYADEDIAAFPERVGIIKLRDMRVLRIESNHALLTGILTGGSVGGVLGFTMADRGNYAILPPEGLAAVNALCGLIVGGVIGALNQKREESFVPNILDTQILHIADERSKIPWPTGIILLKNHSRFKESEPSYLPDIIDNLLKETK